MPEDPSTPISAFYPSPIKNTPRIPPPFPFHDDNNYLSSNNPGSRTRQNILNLINAHENDNLELENSFHGNKYNHEPNIFESVEVTRFNSLSRSSAHISSDNGGGSSSLPRSVISSVDNNRDVGLSDVVMVNGLPLVNTLGRRNNAGLGGRSAIEINRRTDPPPVVGMGIEGIGEVNGGQLDSSSSNELLEQSGFSVDNYITSTVSRNWEHLTVNLTRVPGYGFGIAVSGGCDNPHFANGDPAIAISDVLKGGPAQGKLQINDRIVSANGISLDNVDYSTAVQILRDSGPSVNLRVKRRVNPQSYKVSVPLNSKRLKKLSFESLGFTVSVTIQIKTVDSASLGLREGDIIDKIQGLRVNELFNEKVVCKELRRVLEDQATGNSANLNLTVKRSGSNRNNNNQVVAQQQQQQQQALHQPSHSVGNLYVQPPTRANNKSFDSTNTPLPPPPPPVLSPPPPPPRPPLPPEFENQIQHHAPLRSINFIKQNQLGIRLSGGNKTGIIVSAVQKNSQADLQGLTTNDKIVRVNEHDFIANPPTREQAIEILSSIANDTLVNLTVEKIGNLQQIQMSDNQDEFFVRTRVSTDDVKLHEVLVVTDTLVNGLVGQWEAYRMDHLGNRLDKVVIPNMKNARELLKKSWKRTHSFRNREYEELLQVSMATEPYDIVERRSSDLHTRPLILYTPMNSQLIECLMMMKQASRLFKVVRSVDELDFNDARVRVVQEVISVKGVQELSERGIYPYVVFGNFVSKEALKDACKDAGKYSKCKKLFSVLQKVRDKLGSYVDMVIEIRDCEDGAVRVYESIVQGGSNGRGPGVFYAKQANTSHSTNQNGSASASTTPKRSHSKPRTPSSSQKESTLHRPSSSSHHHSRHKSTDSLANVSSPQQQPTQSSSSHGNNAYRRTPTSPSPNSLKFPNFNIPPPQSIIEQNPIEPPTTRPSTSEYEKRVNLHRSATSIGGGSRGDERSETRTSVHAPTTPTNITNNFAHSPVFERRDLAAQNHDRIRAKSNPPPGGGTSVVLRNHNAQNINSVVPPPMIDRSKKPSSSNANVFYPISLGGSPSMKMTPKPVPPPKPRIIPNSSGGNQNSKPDVNRSLFRPVSNTSTLDSRDSNDDSGQTYLNIPMNSKAALQQQRDREREFLQQQQQQQNVTSGVFDWKGGRLVQKHCFGSQIPIELIIPERAIPIGEQVNVWFQIVDYNVREDNHNPHGQKKMLSPLVKFGPENYRFHVPVEIKIPQYSASCQSAGNDNNMLAKVLMNNQSDYWTKIDIQNGNFQQDGYDSNVKVVSLTVQQF